MTQGIDLDLPDKLEFRVNHEKWWVETSDPAIYLRDRGYTPDPGMHYFTLHWHGRQIPVGVEERRRVVGKNDSGQWVWETHWTVMAIGYPDYASREPAPSSYEFTSPQEYICAANLVLQTMRSYGGAVNSREFNLFPEFREITAELSKSLQTLIWELRWHGR